MNNYQFSGCLQVSAASNTSLGYRFNQIDEATNAKFALEQRQREEAKYRKENSLEWETKLFDLVADNWVYREPLLKRFSQRYN